jgi:glycosyltransferase involved in cell wall biosynthesis
MATKPTVLIAPGVVAHYRTRFYELLSKHADEAGITLKVVASRSLPTNILPGEALNSVDAPLYKLGPFALQNTLTPGAGCDLVIAQQEAKFLANYALQIKRLFSSQRFAFWGHGRNFQSKSIHSLSENIKRRTALHCDWWFAYNIASAAVVEGLGFPPERITLVNNSIDTKALIAARNVLSSDSIESAKASLGIDTGNVAIYTGGLYEEKRMPFLLEAAAKVRAQLPDFHLIIIGGGPQKDLVAEAAGNNVWIHYLGPKNDAEKLPYWAISKVSLIPGAVGLGILDSFALGVPLITSRTFGHGPEIAYLKPGINGVMVEEANDSDAYAAAVVDLLRNEKRRAGMIHAGLRECGTLNIEAMARNFAEGIEAALRADKLKRVPR